MVQSQFEQVVVDIGRPFRQEDAIVLQQADTVVLTLRAEISSLRNAKRTLDFLEQADVGLKKVKPVVNRYRSSGGVSLGDIRSTLGMEIAQVIPDDMRRVNASSDSGVPILLHKPRSSVSKRIRGFVKQEIDFARETNSTLSE